MIGCNEAYCCRGRTGWWVVGGGSLTACTCACADQVVAALLSLFHALQEEEAAHSEEAVAAGGPQRERRVIAPSALREALSALPGQGFKIGARLSTAPWNAGRVRDLLGLSFESCCVSPGGAREAPVGPRCCWRLCPTAGLACHLCPSQPSHQLVAVQGR